MDIQNTKSAENLLAALRGESIARNKYYYFAEVARKNGHEDVALDFEQMANNEMAHAKLWFKLLFGLPETTADCLMNAARGEYSEWHSMYPDFAKTAREEGLEELAQMFEKVAKIERNHEFHFMSLLAKISQPALEQLEEEEEQVELPKEKKVGYRCQFCGAIFDTRPDVCDTCEAIGAFDKVEYYG